MKTIKINYVLKISITAVMLLVFVFPSHAGEDIHQPWDALLKKHVKHGIVDYKGFKTDVKALDAYLDTLNKTSVDAFSREEKLAFWINAYNAFTIKLILNHYPTKSIRDISRPWKKKIWKAAGKTVSLDHIEHKILRKQLKEPRIHFAIVCASIGCPKLQDFAFVPGKLEAQLDLAAGYFFASPKYFWVEDDDDRAIVHISKIFKWFGKDFGDSKKEKVVFMLKYTKEKNTAILKKYTSYKFKYLDYDWNLNGR